MADRHAALVAVMNTGSNVERNGEGMPEPREGRSLAVLPVNQPTFPGSSTTAEPHHFTVIAFLVPMIPGTQVTDADPGTCCRPGSRVAAHHQHCHVSAARNTSQVDAAPVDLLLLAGPLNRVQDVLLSQA